MYNIYIYIYVYIVYIWLVVLLPSEKSAGHWGSSHCYGIFIQGTWQPCAAARGLQNHGRLRWLLLLLLLLRKVHVRQQLSWRCRDGPIDLFDQARKQLFGLPD